MIDAEEIANLGLTKQRKAVFQVILDEPEHLTANEVFLKAKEVLPSISFATVYNSLRYLREAGHIAEIQFGNGASRFDRMTRNHHHAICSHCGHLVDVDFEVPREVLLKAARISRFKPETLEFTLKGTCPKCSQEKNK